MFVFAQDMGFRIWMKILLASIHLPHLQPQKNLGASFLQFFFEVHS
jgi:hypothetical protein